MKRNLNRISLIALLFAVVFATSQAMAAGYVWMDYDNTTIGASFSANWTESSNWSNSTVFVSNSNNDLQFFNDSDVSWSYADGSRPQHLEERGTLTITNVPDLAMKSLVFDGKGPNGTPETLIVIGDSSSTWTIGDGASGSVTDNAAVGGGGDRYVNYTVGVNIDLNQTTTFTGNGGGFRSLVFTGNISESGAGYGITKSGSHRLMFYGTNSYTGPTTISGGTLRLGNAASLPGGMGVSGGTSALTLNGGVLGLLGLDFRRALGTGTNQFQITGGTSGFSAKSAPSYISVNGDPATEIVWGSASFSPSKLVLNNGSGQDDLQVVHSDIVDAPLTLANDIDLNGSTRTVQVNSDRAIISGNITGAAGFTKEGNGMLVLTGTNTYTGNTTISGGILSGGASNSLGDASSDIVFNGGTLRINGASITNIASLGHSVTFSSHTGFDIADENNTFTVDQILNQGGGQFYKYGEGTLVLNQANTFTGYNYAFGGTLILDYSAEDNSKLSANRLYLADCDIVLRGGSHSEASFVDTYLTSYTDSSLTRDSGTATLDLADLNWGTSSRLVISADSIAQTTEALDNGILQNGYVTVGPHFATTSGGDIVAYSGYTAYSDGDSGGNDTTNIEWRGGGSTGGGVQSHCLRIVNTNNSEVLDTTAGGLAVENNYHTHLYAGGWDNRFTITGTQGLRTQNGNQPMCVDVYTGVLTVSAPLTSGGGATLVKSGAGTLIADYNNTYQGATYVQKGVLRLTKDNSAGTTGGGIRVLPGASLELTNSINVGAERLAISGNGIANGGALRSLSGNNTYGGDITLVARVGDLWNYILGKGARINCDSGTLTITGDIGLPSSFLAANGRAVDIAGVCKDITFGGAGDITLSNSTVKVANITKDGAGTLGMIVADSSSNQWICSGMAMNDSTLGFTFDVAPSATVPAIKVMGDLTFAGTPTVSVSIDPADIPANGAPLIEVAGNAPSARPNLQGVSGSLKWAGPGSRTLYLNAASGTLFLFQSDSPAGQGDSNPLEKTIAYSSLRLGIRDARLRSGELRRGTAGKQNICTKPLFIRDFWGVIQGSLRTVALCG